MKSRHPLNFEVLERRNLLTATVAAPLAGDPTVTQSPTVQSLGQNALPATDVPASWPAAGTLTNATPWALIDGNVPGLSGVTRVESVEATSLGIFAPLARSGHSAVLQTSQSRPKDADLHDADTASAPEELPAPGELHLLR